MLANQKDTLFILNLLRLLAFQIGNDISYTELAKRLNSNKKTVMRYLQLLEKTFVIFPLHGFSRNLRSEFTQTPRYFFWDNGIRNILVSNFNSLNVRDDVGKLWENYCISQRMIRNHYRGETVNAYFWRTYTQKEIDMVEEKGGRLYGFEMKWNEKRKVKPPKMFLETYTNSEFGVIDRLNHLDFIS